MKIRYKDFLILQCDHEPAAYLLALDRRTDETIWTERIGGNFTLPPVSAVGKARLALRDAGAGPVPEL